MDGRRGDARLPPPRGESPVRWSSSRTSNCPDSVVSTTGNPCRRRRRKIRSPRLQAGNVTATGASPRSGRQSSCPKVFSSNSVTFTEEFRALLDKHGSSSTKNTFGHETLSPATRARSRGGDVPPPEGGGYGSFAAFGGTDCRSSKLPNREQFEVLDDDQRTGDFSARRRKSCVPAAAVPSRGFQAAVRRHEIRSPRLQAGEKEAATNYEPA